MNGNRFCSLVRVHLLKVVFIITYPVDDKYNYDVAFLQYNRNNIVRNSWNKLLCHVCMYDLGKILYLFYKWIIFLDIFLRHVSNKFKITILQMCQRIHKYYNGKKAGMKHHRKGVKMKRKTQLIINLSNNFTQFSIQ